MLSVDYKAVQCLLDVDSKIIEFMDWRLKQLRIWYAFSVNIFDDFIALFDVIPNGYVDHVSFEVEELLVI